MPQIVMRPKEGDLITFVQGRYETTLVAPVAVVIPDDDERPKFEDGVRVVVGPLTHIVGMVS